MGLLYYGTIDASRALRVSAPTVHTLVLRGELPVAAKTTAGALLFLPEDIEAMARRLAANPRRAGRPHYDPPPVPV